MRRLNSSKARKDLRSVASLRPKGLTLHLNCLIASLRGGVNFPARLCCKALKTRRFPAFCSQVIHCAGWIIDSHKNTLLIGFRSWLTLKTTGHLSELYPAGTLLVSMSQNSPNNSIQSVGLIVGVMKLCIINLDHLISSYFQYSS